MINFIRNNKFKNCFIMKEVFNSQLSIDFNRLNKLEKDGYWQFNFFYNIITYLR